MQHIANMVKAMGWNKLDQLPLEAYLAPMGLYSLRMQFDGTFARDHTAAADEYRAAIARGAEVVGEIGQRAPKLEQKED